MLNPEQRKEKMMRHVEENLEVMVEELRNVVKLLEVMQTRLEAIESEVARREQ